MKELTLFKGHQVRIVLDKEGNAYFHAQDVGDVLEIEDVKSTIRKYGDKHKNKLTNSEVQDMHFRNFHELLNNRGENFLTEAGVYKLSFRSPKREAEEFTDWVTDEVLPSIRKEGAYITDKANQEQLRQRADEIGNFKIAYESTKLFNDLLDETGLPSDIKLLTAKTLYDKAGIHLPINIEADKEYFSTEQIARTLGILSKSQKPATIAVSQIIKKLDIKKEETKEFFEGKGKWQGTVIKYSEAVIDKVKDWVESNSHPSVIQGKTKNYHVQYKLEVIA